MRIREAERADEEALARLFLRERRNTFHWVAGHHFCLEEWAEQSAGERVWLAERGERIVGLVSLWPADRFIHHLYVEEESRGQGVGRALLERALALGSGPASLKVSESNWAAIGFYHRLGWQDDMERGECPVTGPWRRLVLLQAG
ncbi:GNAT family N-acetyltransferase [Aeromonas schubertii]|uniref:Acetyltransferase n=1 Tax=Aeromonas schubertii TaxID=652 RepID=A0A0S2SLY1_9GAMM|nr:GNAT family N-acetyltransferase [Aeromonas schubertii]ALP42720.1 acetyltransferase [Aeromonas schubertii]KUE80524.1 acetyltransferase [Aeromonas schubertii]MBZ6074370.1 GNAT family N-acetyltransferase [Aeromonas schubertii]QCG49010.1 GNAT family N-acetyltransferase [Aeromonas schubertii]